MHWVKGTVWLEPKNGTREYLPSIAIPILLFCVNNTYLTSQIFRKLDFSRHNVKIKILRSDNLEWYFISARKIWFRDFPLCQCTNNLYLRFNRRKRENYCPNLTKAELTQLDRCCHCSNVCNIKRTYTSRVLYRIIPTHALANPLLINVTISIWLGIVKYQSTRRTLLFEPCTCTKVMILTMTTLIRWTGRPPATVWYHNHIN